MQVIQGRKIPKLGLRRAMARKARQRAKKLYKDLGITRADILQVVGDAKKKKGLGIDPLDDGIPSQDDLQKEIVYDITGEAHFAENAIEEGPDIKDVGAKRKTAERKSPIPGPENLRKRRRVLREQKQNKLEAKIKENSEKSAEQLISTIDKRAELFLTPWKTRRN